jgi:hypothetical protein
MHWILQNNLFKESEWDNLVGTLERFKIPYSVHKVIPFIGELVPEPQPLQSKVICFGSYSMRHSARKFGWNPGVYDLFDQNFNVQKQHWGDLMLNFDAEVVAFKDANLSGDTFIRPIDDSKYFAGKVFTQEEFYEWKRNVVVLEHDYGNSLSSDTLIQLCKPKEIYAEYRFWVVDKQIVTCSLYKRGDRVIYSSDVDNHVKRFAESVVRHGDITLSMRTSAWQPHRAYVLDVCETPDGMKIVEINTINSSGFYAAQVQDLVMALEAMENV